MDVVLFKHSCFFKKNIGATRVRVVCLPLSSPCGLHSWPDLLATNVSTVGAKCTNFGPHACKVIPPNHCCYFDPPWPPPLAKLCVWTVSFLQVVIKKFCLTLWSFIAACSVELRQVVFKQNMFICCNLTKLFPKHPLLLLASEPVEGQQRIWFLLRRKVASAAFNFHTVVLLNEPQRKFIGHLPQWPFATWRSSCCVCFVPANNQHNAVSGWHFLGSSVHFRRIASL